MNPPIRQARHLERYSSLTAEEARQYHKIIQHKLYQEISAVRKLNLLKGKLVLECGTGQGKFTQALVKNLLRPNQTLYSIDSAPQMIENIRSKIRRKSFRPLVSDLWKIPFPDNYFDALISHYTLHGLRSKSKDFSKPFKEMIRVLKPGAPLIAMTFYYNQKENSSAYLYHRLIQLNYQDKGINFLGMKNPKVYRDFLKQAGLTNIHLKRIDFDPFRYPPGLRQKIEAIRLREEKGLIKQIKSPKLTKEAQRILRGFEGRPELKNQKIGSTLLLWGKKA